MTETLLILKQMIEERQLLSEQLLSAYNWDNLLDARDRDEEFEGQWLRVSAEVNKLLLVTKVEGEAQELAEDIRKESFLAVSKATSRHELASYISDDFGLIAGAVMVGYNDPWLNGLWMAYKGLGLPKPPVEEYSGQLANLISGDA